MTLRIDPERKTRCGIHSLTTFTLGTDATIAQHIQTVVDREYVMERMEGRTKYLVPSTLGIGLIKGYDRIGFEKNLSKPQLRREVSSYSFRNILYYWVLI